MTDNTHKKNVTKNVSGWLGFMANQQMFQSRLLNTENLFLLFQSIVLWILLKQRKQKQNSKFYHIQRGCDKTLNFAFVFCFNKIHSTIDWNLTLKYNGKKGKQSKRKTKKNLELIKILRY